MVLFDRSGSPDDAGPSRESGKSAVQPSRRVGIFERLGGSDQLARTVAQMHYVPQPGYDGFGLRLPTKENGLLAAIVSDEIEAPFELCRSLRDICPIVLVTSDASLEHRLAAARAGVDAIVRRPLNISELSDWLEHFVTERDDAGVSIVIVDDDALMGGVYAEALRAAGMTVALVTDPMLAIERIDTTRPDLILMDISMPGVSGIELSRIIRQSRQYLSVPIVFFSAEQDAERQLEARKYGGDDFISKPVDLDRLVSLVRLRTDRARTLRSLIERDGLTGLYNHGRFKDRLAQEIERCRRVGTELSFAMIDLDRFKLVNDTFGHPVGDTVIRAAANLLFGKLRRIDVVGRYGGEEFGVILLDTPPQLACTVIDGLREHFGELAFTGLGRQFSVTFSAGIAGSRHRRDLQQLIAAADEAVYAAKAGGRNRVALDRTAIDLAPPTRASG